MVGYIQTAVAYALRKWEPLEKANVVLVRATDGDSAVVNTTLPAVVVHVNGVDGQGNTYIGGGIRLYYEVSLHVLLPVINYTFSEDKGAQESTLNLSNDVLSCMELTTELQGIKQRLDASFQFNRVETDHALGSQGSAMASIDVQRIIYDCDVQFDPTGSDVPTSEILEKINYEIEHFQDLRSFDNSFDNSFI